MEKQLQIKEMKRTIKKLREWGKMGDNSKFFKRASCIEKRLEKIELLDEPVTNKQLPLDFKINNRSGKEVLNIKNYDLNISNRTLISDLNLILDYGDKVCLMGKNGCGKSTLIKSILNSNSSNIKLGSNISVGYIPQEITFDNNKDTVLDVARKFFIGEESNLRSALSKYMFYNEMVFKRVGTLSGGEKVRLKLFELIEKKANFLILDEPTNHIDIDTREVLEEALNNYEGTLLFISHDRYFINKLASKILYIEDNKLKEYCGNYDYYKEKMK